MPKARRQRKAHTFLRAIGVPPKAVRNLLDRTPLSPEEVQDFAHNWHEAQLNRIEARLRRSTHDPR